MYHSAARAPDGVLNIYLNVLKIQHYGKAIHAAHFLSEWLNSALNDISRRIQTIDIIGKIETKKSDTPLSRSNSI